MRACAIWLVFSLTVAPMVLVTTAAMVGVIGGLGVAFVRLYGPLGLLLSASGFAVSYAAAVAVHEMGHVVGGGAVGWRARFVRVGPVTWTRRGDRWRFGWNRRSNWITGKVEAALGPRDPWRLVIFLMAGPAANFVLGAVAGGIVIAPLPFLPRCAAGLLAMTSICLGAWSLVPLRERGEASDGLNLWRLLAHGTLPLTIKKMAFAPAAPASIRSG